MAEFETQNNWIPRKVPDSTSNIKLEKCGLLLKYVTTNLESNRQETMAEFAECGFALWYRKFVSPAKEEIQPSRHWLVPNWHPTYGLIRV